MKSNSVNKHNEGQSGDLLDGPVRPLPEETYETGEGPRCPFCGQQWTADDAIYFDEDGFDADCDECGNEIRVDPIISVAWKTKPVRWANTSVSGPCPPAGQPQQNQRGGG
jgi:hypothetical protein